MRFGGVREFVENLTEYRFEGAFNPWGEQCTLDAFENAATVRRNRLFQHLSCPEPKVLLVGEAPGYQGCRYSGIAFTSERLVCAGEIPRVSRPPRITSRAKPWSEPSATIVWGALQDLGLAEHALLWNAFPFHPFKPGSPFTNRRPTWHEISHGAIVMRALVALFSGVEIVPVGRVAEELLRSTGIQCANYVRHPANGGARLFREGLERIVSNV